MAMEVRQKTRKLSIRNKILIPILGIILVISILMGMVSYLIGNWCSINTGVEKSHLAASIAASMVDGDYLRGLKKGSETTDAYKVQLAQLREIQETCGILFLYTIYEEDGVLYYGVDTDTSEGQRAPGTPYDGTNPAVKNVLQGEHVVQDYIDKTVDGDLISSYVPIYGSDGSVVCILGCDYDGSEISRLLTIISGLCAGAAVVFLVIAAIVVIVFISGITKNIILINDKVYDLVNNEGDLTQKLDIHSGDELELIGSNINNLLEYIRNIMLNISGNSNSLKDSSEVVSDNLKNAEINITEVSATMEQMSAGMEETSASIVEITNAIHDVYNAIEEINHKASVSADHAYQAMEKAEDIYANAITAQEQAKNRTDAISVQVAERIEKSKAVKEIEELTDSILNIADQTNLLALNASIEAARAGEAGRGFAVVADEIGKLAQDSATSASKIRQVSAEVIEAVEHLADISNDMIHFVDETTMDGFSRLQQTAFGYKEDVHEMSSTMQDFTASCQELKSNMDNIKDSIEAANIAVEESAKGISNVSEISVNLTASVSDIQNQANGNMDIAGLLNNEVNRFKL